MIALERAEGPRPGSGAMFDRIAGRYDLLNRIISLGVDQGWRKKTVAALEVPAGGRVLDLATGTADLALSIARRTLASEVVGLDPSGGMLEIGRAKIDRLGLQTRVRLVQGEAERLGFEAGSFEAASIAFGIRNVADRPRALSEVHRVLAPGGRFAVLELSEPEGGWLGPLARFHIRTVVPWLGALLSGQREYRYLQRSIAAFPRPAVFADMLRAAGFEVTRVQPLTFGVAVLYVGVRR